MYVDWCIRVLGLVYPGYWDWCIRVMVNLGTRVMVNLGIRVMEQWCPGHGAVVSGSWSSVRAVSGSQ